MGLSLEKIGELLSERESSSVSRRILRQQLDTLNVQITQLQTQQLTILKLLGEGSLPLSDGQMTKEQWVGLLESIGLSDEDMWQWHRNFERLMPEAHQAFLESLSIPRAEIEQIRLKSKP